LIPDEGRDFPLQYGQVLGPACPPIQWVPGKLVPQEFNGITAIT